MENINFESENFRNFDWSQLKKVIFDFDSTFYKGETLDEFLNFVLKKRNTSAAEHQIIMDEISAIQKKGMTDEGSIAQSLQERLALIKPTQAELDEYMKIWLEQELEPHNNKMLQIAAFLHTKGIEIHILSGGFKYMIDKYLEKFAPFINTKNVYANEFLEPEDNNGITYLNADFENLMAQADGKSAQILKIITDASFDEKFMAIGDSPRDLLSKIPEGMEQEMQEVLQKVFKVAFTEFKSDKAAVVAVSDIEISNATDLAQLFEEKLVQKETLELVGD